MDLEGLIAGYVDMPLGCHVDGISQNCFLNATTCSPMAPTTAAMPGAGMRLAGMAAHGAGAFGFGVVVVAARFTEITESTESH